MAKLAVAALVLVALLAVAQASFRTIVTTTIEEDNLEQQQGKSQQRCQQQVQQRLQQLQSCRQYLQPSSSFMIDMYVNQRQSEKQQLRECCQQLRVFGPQCSCEAVKQIVWEHLQQFGQGQQGQGGQQGQQGQGEWGGQQGQEGQGQWGGQQQQQVQRMLQKARNLPQECNVGGQCQIQSPY